MNMMRRTCGVKIRRYLLHIGLFIAVVISLILSAIIWVDPATFHRTTMTQTTTNESTSVNNNISHYSWDDVYLPTNIVLTKNKQQFQLTSNQQDIVEKMRDESKNVHIKDISVKESNNFNTYHNELLNTDNIMLSYSGPMSIGIFEKIIDKHSLFNHYADRKFKHLVMPLNNHKVVYLFNDNDLKVYRVDLKEDIPSKVYEVVNGKNIQQTPVQYQEITKNIFILNYPQGVSVPKYSYLISKENTSLFVTHLLGSSSSNSIGTQEHKGVTVYSTDNGQRLMIDNKTGMVNYTSAQHGSHRDKMSFNKILRDNFDNLNNLGVTLDNVRYQGYNPTKRIVTYQSYINNYPIISNNDYGTYEINLQKDGTIQYTFSIDNLQVPLPNNDQKVNLPPTNQIIQDLHNNNYDINKVQNIEVGYDWSQNPDSQMVVDLIPTYFIKYNGRWINYQNLNKNH